MVLYIFLENLQRYTASGGGKITAIPKRSGMAAPELRAVAIEEEFRGHGLETGYNGADRGGRRNFKQKMYMVCFAIHFD